jgi:ketosteroid isomerase-like protein
MKTILISLIFIVSTGCQQFLMNKKSQKTTVQQVDGHNISKEFSHWVDAVNDKNVDAIKGFYRPESIKIISPDSKLSGPAEIAEYYALQSENIKSISSLYIVKANKETNIDYEITKYETLSGKSFAQLLIWSVKNGDKFIEFEFVSEISEATHNNEKSITEKRNLWIEICNTHNPENLVNTLYSSNSIYFNHKPLIKGKEKLIEEYSYMKNANYKLTLVPLKMLSVNANLVYEIGQCEGTYNGKYILIWQKENDGVWRVFIDSNI